MPVLVTDEQQLLLLLAPTFQRPDIQRARQRDRHQHQRDQLRQHHEPTLARGARPGSVLRNPFRHRRNARAASR
ncbi:hypothetical protein [Paraburkholderia nemoris]|uniref:hypothetical protein n=1 Tax=Paraburkholderia nemoris TaxID=2793076 RepID=UPI00155ECB09|nr:hypothetical protein [Paraburkholderia nemoris]MBK3742325.1 hypothetical protein [Paraburkholderia aspalathi]MBK3811202.1 hypothetical protein [Paraburkholderia aspalathi]MBK5148198.1 hypothetical protein [Burkholderia sp. R-69608]